MLCEECNHNQATLMITVMTGNETTTRHLCEECVEKMKTSFEQGDVSSFLSSLLSVLSKQPKQTELKCETCGMTYEEFQSNGKLGCAQCYQTFSEQLKPLLLRVHGRSQHAGRVPRNEQGVRELELSILELKTKMEQAVNVENFEAAAVLRDEIRSLVDKRGAEVKPQ